MTFEGKSVTYGELDAMANRYAHWAKGLNLRRGQTVALFMPNRMEYFPIWYGLSKVGVVTALINNQLAGQQLAHCLIISGANHVIVDAETSPVFEQAKPLIERPLQQWVLGPANADQRDYPLDHGRSIPIRAVRCFLDAKARRNSRPGMRAGPSRFAHQLFPTADGD